MNYISSFFRTAEKGEDKKYTKNGIMLLTCRVIILGMTLLYIVKAFIGAYYHEIDSYVLPTISMEYRHSLLITQEDIGQAKIDYPEYYKDVDDFESLRSSRLKKVTQDRWASFYFPSYSACCMPLKLIFQLIGADQMWAFTVTNALFVIAALIYMYNRLKVPPLFKLLAVLMFVLSPIDMYIQYISAEAMMFSLVTIALVMYTNEKYRLSAVLISVASMTNPTVMGFGIVMVAEYLVRMFSQRRSVKIFSRGNILETLKYACCFLPCFVPFVFNFIYLGTGNPTTDSATVTDYGARVLSYLFDVNIGFSALAPVTLAAFLVLTAVSLARKDFTALRYFGFFIVPLLAYSLMLFINCVPVFFVRYVMWNYPALILGTVVLGSRIIVRSIKRYVFSGVVTASTAAMLCINSIPMYYFGFNGASRFLLEYFPELYSPYRGTFYAGTDGFSWGYTIDRPSMYFSPDDGTLRKCLFRASDEYKAQIVSMLKGSSEDISKFSQMVDSVPSDGGFHYINVSHFSGIKLWKKTSEEMGLLTADGAALDIAENITAGRTGCILEPGVEPPEKYALYKLEIEFGDGDFPRRSDNFSVNAFGEFYKERLIGISGENTMSIICPADEDIQDPEISLRCDRDVRVKSVSLTPMKAVSAEVLADSDSHVELPESNEDGVLIPAEYEPMKNYFLDVTIPEGSISDDDEVYCMLYYSKRFNQEQAVYQLTDGENRFLVNSGDTTIVSPAPDDGFYVKFFGSSGSPVTVEYAALSIAQ